MAGYSSIEWTDATWTPIRARNKAIGKIGWHCEHASPGCANCYSETFNEVRLGTGLPFKPGHRGDVEHFLDEKILTAPLHWRRPRRVFVCSMTDLFGDWVPDEWIDRVFALMFDAPQHTFQVLTKRSARMRAYMNDDGLQRRIVKAISSRMGFPPEHGEAAMFSREWPLPNVWLGVSAEDQRRADERVPDLLATPAAVRFVSAEPLLGPLHLGYLGWPNGTAERRNGWNSLLGWRYENGEVVERRRGLDWVIVGGESGPGARPMCPDWARSLRDQCAAAGVPFHFKQWGEWAPANAVGIVKDRPITDKWGNVRDWMSRYVVANDDAWAARVRGHSFTEHATDLVYRVGKKAAGRLLDGVEHNGMPEVRA